MDARRIVQLALGVPDAIQPGRRDGAAVLALAHLGGFLNGESLEDAGAMCRPAFEAIVTALDDGDLDGWLLGYEDPIVGRRRLAKVLRRDHDGPVPVGTGEALDLGGEHVVAWAIEHPMLDHLP